jgi:hypothetical protein
MGNQRQSKTLHSKTHHERQKGHVCNFFTNQVPAIQIVNFYKGKVLHKLKTYFKNRRPANGLRGVRLLHNNASYCTRISETWKGCRDFSPSLFARSYPLWLLPFSETQKTPCWKKILNAKKFRVGYFQVSEQNTSKDYENALNWIKRLKLCISHGGEYFEGLR